MALTFSTSDTDVDHGSDASIDNMETLSILAWIYPTTSDTTYRYVTMKHLFGSEGGFSLAVTDQWDSATPESFGMYVADASGNSDNAWGATNSIVLNAWNFIGATWAGVGNAPVLYNGSLTSIVTATTINNSSANMTGAVADASYNLLVGQHSNASSDFLGDIAIVYICEEVLTLGQIRKFQFRPQIVGTAPRLLTFYGFGGTGTQPDYSGNGNNGTVTGATVADHVPLGPPFGKASVHCKPAASLLTLRV
jgi:hypothetical protein